MRRCVFAGTFDPPTLGHKDIVLKCLELFDEVIVAILINPNKKPLFGEEERLAMLRKVFAGYKNVRVLSYDGLTVDLLRRENAKFYVRGIRNGTDYDYEAQLNYINMDMYKEMITVFLPTRQEFLHISSSLVKDALRFNKNVDKYVPEEIRGDLKKYMQEANKQCSNEKN
ncbi:MAG TPA: pantetheine-phosphate adenylyltransferase [Candidatus Borkfalkia excrementigallinarum]|uniref:Phosphopantetheine adenylyltransferase n=1 Tax=Candidatus Borkfalkia excrementigallinarum TaxID=2838506 RepID=A0A9D2A0S6_9FIRM|nr:pantetheine-phosphate adenylyltransferase [Candidatus Borkfalkia excrementigallinarum]